MFLLVFFYYIDIMKYVCSFFKVNRMYRKYDLCTLTVVNLLFTSQFICYNNSNGIPISIAGVNVIE